MIKLTPTLNLKFQEIIITEHTRHHPIEFEMYFFSQ